MTTECVTTTVTAPQGARPIPSRPAARVVAAVTAVAFVAYPVLRPYSNETGAAGARAFAEPAWLWAHLLGMAGFVGLAWLASAVAASARVRAGLAGGAALVLPYYGAEAFGLHALGRAALERGEPGLIGIADTVRYNPMAMSLFGTGLALVAVAGIGLGVHLWRRGLPVAGVLVALGTAGYLPQFFGPPWLRVVHGGVLAVGLLLVASRTGRRIER